MVQLSLKNIILAALSTIIGALITGYFFSIGEDLWQRTKEGVPTLPNLLNPFWYISVPLAIIGVLLVVYDIYLLRRKLLPQVGSVPSSPKRVRWFSRLRFPVKKEKKADFILQTVVMAILGVTTIAIAVSFSSASLPQERIPIFLLGQYAMIGFGILLVVFSAWFGINLLYSEWDSRKQHQLANLTILDNYDHALEAVETVHERDLKTDMLHNLDSKLTELCNNSAWEQVKDRINKILELIPDKLSNEPHVYLKFLDTLIRHYDEHVKNAINKKWGKELEELYEDPHYDTVSILHVFYILQELHNYDKDYMEKLVNDATQWTKLRFDTLWYHIGFSELKKRDTLGYRKIVKRLLGKMDDAKRDNEEQTLFRLRTLYNMAEEKSVSK